MSEETMEMNDSAMTSLAETAKQLLAQGQTDKAETIFLGLRALAPQEPYFTNALGVISLQRKHYNSAEALFSQALESNPNHIEALTNRGETRVYLNDLNGAVKDLVTALHLAPDGNSSAISHAQVLIQRLYDALQHPHEEQAKQITPEDLLPSAIELKKLEPPLQLFQHEAIK